MQTFKTIIFVIVLFGSVVCSVIHSCIDAKCRLTLKSLINDVKTIEHIDFNNVYQVTLNTNDCYTIKVDWYNRNYTILEEIKKDNLNEIR